jgi:aminoglycoside phosphotransferase (APT) family kinase protein
MDAVSLNALAWEIAHSAIGAKPHSVREEPRGVMTFKSIIRMSDGDEFVVRFYPKYRSHIVDFEPDLMRIAAAAGVLVPEVVTDSRSKMHEGLSFVMYRLIPGKSLAEVWPSLSTHRIGLLAAEIARNVGLLTRIPVSGYGGLRTAKEARFPTWAEFLRSSIDSGMQAAQTAPGISAALSAKLEAFGETCGQFSQCNEPTIAWSDISPENIIVSRDGILAGLIDFEGMLSGDHMMTLGYLKAKFFGTEFGTRVTDAMQPGADASSTSKINFFAVLRGLRLIRHLHQPLPTGAERLPIEETLPGFEPALDALLTSTT